jgi:hypothetical protein
VNGELKDVAKGTIIQPLNRQFHGMPMPSSVYRVKISLVLGGYESMEPPAQPKGCWEEDETMPLLTDCYNYFLQWPKSQIRLGAAAGTTPQTA